MKLTTPIVITFSATLVILVGYSVFLIATGHDPGVYVNGLVSLFSTLPALAGIAITASKTQAKVETVQKQTNGTLSTLHAQVAAKDAENKALRSILTPEQISKVAPVDPTVVPTEPAAPALDPISHTLPSEASTGATTTPATFPATVDVEADKTSANV